MGGNPTPAHRAAPDRLGRQEGCRPWPAPWSGGYPYGGLGQLTYPPVVVQSQPNDAPEPPRGRGMPGQPTGRFRPIVPADRAAARQAPPPPAPAPRPAENPLAE